VTILSALATLFTPLGVGLWGYVLTSIPRSRENGIDEWASAFHLGAVEVGLWLWTAGLVVTAWLRWRRLNGWRDPLILVVALVMAPLAFSSVRNIPMFALVSLPALVALTRSTDEGTPRAEEREVGHGIVALASMAIAASCVAVMWSIPHSMLGWQPVPPEISAAITNCPGPLYNRYDEGGYLIWAVPEVPVFVDSRQDPYPQEFLREHGEAESSGAYGEVFARYELQCAALPPGSPTARALVEDGWKTTAESEQWVVLYPPE
jgi:hypothetical protein